MSDLIVTAFAADNGAPSRTNPEMNDHAAECRVLIRVSFLVTLELNKRTAAL